MPARSSSFATTATRPLPQRPKRISSHAQLRVVFPEGLAAAIDLLDAPVILGRAGEADIARVDHLMVSRRHLKVTWNEASKCHQAVDLGSHNGSWLDGVPLDATPRTLSDGTVVRIGDVLLVYERARDVYVTEADDASMEAIPGSSRAARALRAAVAQAGPDPSPVLLLGESGTGKEWIANELHRLSGRPGKPIAINCGALSPQLMESQLFGHVRGAFTGANEAQAGMFRSAHKGTLFLDEMGELPLDLQPKLLRVLQEGEVIPVGSSQGIRVDVRVIAATHRDLAACVEAGTFRRDLYARLSLVELHVPALRERRVDLFDWIETLRVRWCERRPEKARGPFAFEPDAAEALLLSAWSTNLRGIDRLVHEISALGGASPITKDQLPAWIHKASSARGAPELSRKTETPPSAPLRSPPPTRAQFEAAYAELGGNVRALSRHFDRDRRQIYRWMESYGLKEKG